MYSFDSDLLKTLRFDPADIQKRDILISGYLREQSQNELFFPMVIIHLILIRLPKFKGCDETELVIAGYLSSGKSSMIKQIVYNDVWSKYKFKENEEPTSGANYMTNRYHNKLMNKKIRLNVRDLSGNGKYRTFMRAYLKDADITVIVYDITKEESLKYALDLIDNDVDRWQFP